VRERSSRNTHPCRRSCGRWPETSSSALVVEKKFVRRLCRRSRARARGTSRARAPREREEAPGVALVHGLPLGGPVRGELELELAGGGAEGERRLGWFCVGFSACVSFTRVLRGCWCGSMG